MFLGWFYNWSIILVQIGNPTWLPGPIMCSDWLKFWKSSCHKLLSRWNCSIIEMMTGWSSTKFVIFVPIAYPRWPPQGNNSLPLDPMGISFKDLFLRNYLTNWIFCIICECSLDGSTPDLLFWCRLEIQHGRVLEKIMILSDIRTDKKASFVSPNKYLSTFCYFY